jgi:hypothetical protein
VLTSVKEAANNPQDAKDYWAVIQWNYKNIWPHLNPDQKREINGYMAQNVMLKPNRAAE